MSRPPAPGGELWLLDDGRIMGGGQRFAARLARFAAREPDAPAVRVVCPGDSELARTVEAPVEDLPFPDPDPRHAVRLAWVAWRLRRLLAERGPPRAVVGNAARAQGVAVLATAGGPAPLVHLMHEQDSAARPLARRVHRRTGRVVAVGSNAAAAYAASLRGTRVDKLNNFLLPEEVERLAAVRRPREPGPGVLGVLSRVIPEKGLVELVDALREAEGAWRELRVAGPRQDEAYARRVEARAAEAGLADRVRLLGQVDDVPDFLAGIDALLVPSVGNEAQPTAIVEALAAGVPVLVRRSIFSVDYAGLPVAAYDAAPGLARALGAPGEPAAPGELLRRFGPRQALDTLLRAAGNGD